MKTLPAFAGKFFLVIAVSLVLSCDDSAQTNAAKTAKQIQSAVKENSPGYTAVSENGYYLKAKIDGKDWTAKAMMLTDKMDSKIISGDNNGESISFHLGMGYVTPGRKKNFSDTNAVDLLTNDEVAVWGGTKGELEITKVDGKWVEGKFHFTATSHRSNKTIEVTDGKFRIVFE